MALSLVTAPAAEPISTANAKAHLRVDTSADDTLIDDLVKAARRVCERITGRALITQTWDWKLDRFPAGKFIVPLPPLSSVTSITYTDSAGDSQTWAASKYDVDAPVGPHAAHGRIAPAYGEVYPTTRDEMNAVVVRFVAGYGSAGSDVPDDLIRAMHRIVADNYANRENYVIGAGVAKLPGDAMETLMSYMVDV
jgi:uncharacterized phiE125 gp8 family phage protein